jgi:hypothetical protein
VPPYAGLGLRARFSQDTVPVVTTTSPSAMMRKSRHRSLWPAAG